MSHEGRPSLLEGEALFKPRSPQQIPCSPPGGYSIAASPCACVAPSVIAKHDDDYGGCIGLRRDAVHLKDGPTRKRELEPLLVNSRAPPLRR